MSFLLKWLGLSPAGPKVGLHPHRDVDVPLAYDAAYDRVIAAIELTLGANVSIDDRRGGTIEARFGVVNNERIRCTLVRTGETTTRVRIEAFFPAGAEIPSRSRAVDALANSLTPSQ